MSLLIDAHREFLSDSLRLETFRAAIHEVVRPGDVVVDLASGTGVLGLFACEAGAKRVLSIEATAMTEVARDVARANGFADRVTFIRELSTLADTPERADVVITDQIGHLGFDAGLWEYLTDARRRFLKPGGRLLPESIGFVVAPVEAPALFERVNFWESRPAGLDFSPVRTWAANTGYPAHLSADAVLAAPFESPQMTTLDMTRAPISIPARFTVTRSGDLHGVGGWFVARLTPGVRLTNAPGASDRINRRNVFLPLSRAVRVDQGDVVEVTLQIDPVETVLGWTVVVHRKEVPPVSFRHSTVRGMLIAPDELNRMRPDFTPVLTARGVARRTVLELCDGRRPLAEIERQVFVTHPELFASEADAAVFVAEVVSRYSC